MCGPYTKPLKKGYTFEYLASSCNAVLLAIFSY